MDIGPTGNFPRGKIANDDEGEIKIMITTREDCVHVIFGTSIRWLAFDTTSARGFAEMILDRCDIIDNQEREKE